MYTHSDKSLKALITLTSTITLLCALHQMRMAEIGNLHKFHTRFVLALVAGDNSGIGSKSHHPPPLPDFFFFSLRLLKLSRISVDIAWSFFFCKNRHVKRDEITTICYKLDGEENDLKVPVQWCMHSAICYRDSKLWREERKVIFHFLQHSWTARVPVHNVIVLL